MRQSPLIMGILNCSPDSFYGGGSSMDENLRNARLLIEEGADWLDIGGEATNLSITLTDNTDAKAARECERIIPLIEALKKESPIRMSVDTSQPLTMQAALDAGADMINDQRALSLPGALDVVVGARCPVVLMHSSLAFPSLTESSDCVADMSQQLKQHVQKLLHGGLQAEQIVLDPGFGQGNYGKNLAVNCELLRRLRELDELGYPLLVGWSRKSMVGDLAGGCEPSERLPGSLAAAVVAAQQGARYLRVHDVAETRQAMQILHGIESAL